MGFVELKAPGKKMRPIQLRQKFQLEKIGFRVYRIDRIEQIEEVLAKFSEISSEYQIRISHLDGKDTMRIYVETNGSVDFENLSRRIAEKVKSRIGFTPLVKVVEIGVLPRSMKKTARVIDERYD